MSDKFQIQPELTGLSLAYRNGDYIADKVFKRVPVTTKTFEYKEYAKSMNLQVPNTLVGDKGEPNVIDFKGVLKQASVRSDALIDDVSQVDIDESANKNENLLADSTAFLTDCFDSARERRLAELLADTSIYNGNYKILTASEKISNDSVNAHSTVRNAMDNVWFKPNTMIMGRGAANALRQNPSILKAANKSTADVGFASIEQLQELFEIENILIGTAKGNNAKLGQVGSFGNIWGNHIILAYINPQATVKQGITFGITAEFMPKEISTFFNPRAGVRGVTSVKIAEQIGDVIVAPECGYLLKNVI